MRVHSGLKDSVKKANIHFGHTHDSKYCYKCHDSMVDIRTIRRANKAGLALAVAGVVALLVVWCGVTHASESQDGIYMDSRIVEAIKLTEGKNKKGWYSYGIKSVRCEAEEECREICLRTVRNLHNRFRRQTVKTDLLAFIGNVYCPIGAKNDPKCLNKNWLKNVNYFLNHPKKG